MGELNDELRNQFLAYSNFVEKNCNSNRSLILDYYMWLLKSVINKNERKRNAYIRDKVSAIILKAKSGDENAILRVRLIAYYLFLDKGISNNVFNQAVSGENLENLDWMVYKTMPYRNIADIVFGKSKNPELKTLFQISIIFDLTFDLLDKYFEVRKVEETLSDSASKDSNAKKWNRKPLLIGLFSIALILVLILSLSHRDSSITLNSNSNKSNRNKESEYLISNDVFIDSFPVVNSKDSIGIRILNPPIPKKNGLEFLIEINNYSPNSIIPSKLFPVLDEIVEDSSNERYQSFSNSNVDYILINDLSASYRYKSFLNGSFRIAPKTLNTVLIVLGIDSSLQGNDVLMHFEFEYKNGQGISTLIKSERLLLGF